MFSGEPRRPEFTHDLAIIERSIGGGNGAWKANYALLRGPEGQTSYLEGWEPGPEITIEPESLWEYWDYKVGGNGYTSEVAWCWTAPEFAADVVSELDHHLRESGHPLGLKFGQSGNEKSTADEPSPMMREPRPTVPDPVEPDPYGGDEGLDLDTRVFGSGPPRLADRP